MNTFEDVDKAKFKFLYYSGELLGTGRLANMFDGVDIDHYLSAGREDTRRIVISTEGEVKWYR